MSKKITLENVDSSELPEIPVIGEVKQIRFTQDMELVSTLADSDLFMVQAGADLEARPNTITFDLIIKNLSGPIEEGSKKFVTGDMMFKVIGDMNLLNTWDNTNLVSSLNATYVNVRRIEEELRREINRSTGKDEQHDEQIANLRQDLTSTNEMLNQEISRSVAKDKEHDDLLEGLRDDVDSTSNKLDAEIDRSTAKDAEHDTLLKGLRVDVNANKSAIDSEVARSTARDEAHDTAIAKNASDITTEVNRAKAEEAKIRQEMQTADTNLQNAITAETERATGVEEDLQQQITDLSGSTDDRLEALEALSHEQNTDTGTTSKTFVIDSGNTGAMLKAEGGGLSTRTKGDAGYANFTVNNLVIKGDVTQEGDTFITRAERVEVRDNMILINEGETGAGVTAGFAGIEVDRGTEQNFMFGFNESDGMFKIGKEGNMFDVALRQPVGDMTDGMFASWDAATKTFKTTNLIPPTLQLYLGVPGVSVKYVSLDDGSIKFMTNGNGWSTFTGNNVTCFRSDVSKFQFIGDVSIYSGKLNTSASTFKIRVAGGSSMVIDGTGSTLSTPLTSTTYYRSSDDSEVLYQADLKSVLTGKETNYAPTVKAVSDAIDAVNTGTAESLKNYLKLSGGNMTGIITMNNGLGIFAKNTNGVDKRLISKSNTNRVYVGDTDGAILIHTNSSHVGHFRDGVDYMMYDSYNLPDPATKSGNNSFTGTNSFVGGKFSVAGSESEVYVSAVGNLVTRSTYGTTDWLRSLEFSDNDVVVARFGVNATTKNNVPTTNFVGILVGNGSVNDSQYKFGTNKLTVPESWSMIDGKNDAITLTSNSSIFGRISTPLYLRGDNTDLFHTKNSTNYKVWDASNLPTPASTSDIPDVSDMARRSEANTFTANNTFTAGQFNVGPLKVTSSGSILVNLSKTGGWSRNITWENNSDQSTKVMVGGYHNAGDAFVWMGVGDLSYKESQYRFYGTKMVVPIAWSLDDKSGNSLVWSESTQLAHLGRAMGTTKIRSGAVDLIHTKGTTDYKILDESNYSQYLPTPSKWTYGFVATSPGETKVDFNTVLSGPDSPKILLNYNHQLGSDTNAPSGMTYGTVLQIDGNYNSNYNNNALRPQLAFDVNHNVEASTRYMWFRTANNLGFGDSSNWKRVVTADENVVAFITANGYPTVGRLDGSDIGWLRTPANGLLPTSPTPLANGGNSSLGNSSWSFSSASIANVYANNYYFGNTGIHLEGNDDEIGLLNAGTAKKLKVGSLLVSSNYSDTTKVPTNGIFASGAIKSYSGFTSNFRLSDINITKTGNYVWHLSSFANSPENMPGIDPVSRQVIDDGALLTYFWETDYAFQLAGDIDGTGMAYRSYTPSTGATKAWKFLADTAWVNTKLGSYLPLAGGTMTGKLTINTSTTNPLAINNTNAAANEVYIQIQRTGTALAAIGNMPSNGSYIYNYAAAKYLFVGNDGCYFGTPSSNAKLLTTADNVITAVGGENYVNVSLSEAAKASAGAAKYLEWYDATPGWYNFRLGSVTANGDVVSTGSFYSQTNHLLKYVHNSATHSAISVNKTDGGGYLMVGNHSSMMKTFLLSNNSDIVHYRGTDGSSSTGYIMWDAYNLPSPATQSWVTSQGYLTSITKSMVTTALGYTPPTTNTTYSQATSSTLGLVKIGATGLASKNYAVQLNSSGQMYVAVPWTDTNTTYSAATSSTYGLVKIGATGLAAKNYAVQLNSSGQMYVAVPWTDTDTNTHYTTRLYAGASGTAANSETTSPYIKVTDDDTYRNQIRLLGGGATSVSSDASGNITITSTNTTYGLATASSNGLMSSSQYTKLSNCIETVSATNMVTSVQVVDTIPATSSQVTGRLYLKFA